MSSQLFHVTIQSPSLPGQILYPKLATVKLEDPQLQPVVERKGCQKALSSMRDCLVENHGWDKCNLEVEKFQECINTKYFEDKNESLAEIEEEPVKDDIIVEENVIDLDEKKIDYECEIEEPTNDESIEENNSENIEKQNIDTENADKHNIDTENAEENKTDTGNSEEGNNAEDAEVLQEDKLINNEQEVIQEEVDEIVDDGSFRVKIIPNPNNDAVVDDENILFKINVKTT